MQNQVPESKQICVSSGSFEPQHIICNLINKQPVWFYMSIPVTFEIALQGDDPDRFLEEVIHH